MSTSSNVSAPTVRPATSESLVWAWPALTALVVGLAYGPYLWWFFADQWARPHYQYFPFVLGAFLWLLWQRFSEAAPRVDEHSTARRFAMYGSLGAAFVLLALATLINRPWLAYLSFICLLTGFFLRVASRWQVCYLWGIWAMLWLIRPLPLNRDQQLIGFLQQLSSRLSSRLLDWVGVTHLMEGNTLLLAEKRFFVDEACSGIVSVMSIIACAVIYGVWRNRAPVHVVLLALAGVGWATLMNVMRITTIALAFNGRRLDWSTGTTHEVLGLVVFTVTFLALISTDYLLLGLLAPIKQRYAISVGRSLDYGANVAKLWDRLQMWGAPAQNATDGDERPVAARMRALTPDLALGLVPLMALTALAGAQVAIPYVLSGESKPMESLANALALNEVSVPSKVGGAGKTDFETAERAKDDVFGSYSRIYKYRDESGNVYVLSCDFPFNGWHELSVCYRGIGWEMTNRHVQRARSAAEDPSDEWSFAEASFTKTDGSVAYLVYCSFDEYGTRLSPPSNLLWDEFQLAIRRRFRGAFSDRTFQIQVLSTSIATVREEQKQTARKLLLGVREPLRQAIISGQVPGQE